MKGGVEVEEENKKVPLIELRNLTKKFGGTMVLDSINLKIYENEFVTLLGPSGCGKTTNLESSAVLKALLMEMFYLMG